tara:strand:+ start:2234 stop:2755 length:522 start_codon:yes stop_codon:yes gene_type:complete
MPKNKNNVFLIGPMGSGKTSVAKKLSAMLRKKFVDTDIAISNKTGVDINYIFDVEGEVGFRKREEAALKECVLEQNIVLSTGGGIVLSANNRLRLKKHGVVVYLETSVESQEMRTLSNHNRPLLKNTEHKKTLQELMLTRGRLYEEIADITINTDDKSLEDVATEVGSKINEY